MLEHGGRLRVAAQRYGIAEGDWLDLSTGIAPYGWPLPSVPTSAWARLPEWDDGLEEAARQYYGTDQLLPVAGSQAAIQALPRMRERCRVGVLSPCYAEHSAAWRREGHELVEIDADTAERELERFDVVLVVNPTNPTGLRLSPERLLAWHARLAQRGGWLLVDEAFIDCTPEQSLAGHCPRSGLLVLRSFGKFFGMAGIRLGFVLAEPRLLDTLNEWLGPWTISGPARAVARAILLDQPGQALQRQRLLQDGQRLEGLLRDCGLPPTGGSALFQWLARDDAPILHDFLARRGILTRLFEHPASLRLGLPPDAASWARLQRALTEYTRERP
ncbi:threonine-phosphate decarboxylase CobD [Pseudomonas boanensis]|uniref:threonine-phosphate decarboxylase CobD n=1 Tax=Metapseudomonas boanensis TaxID=2822138 RepID=UPI0035D47F65